MLDTLVKDHTTNLKQANKSIKDSTLSNQQVTEKVDKLISDAKIFISDLYTAAEANAVKANEAISKLSTSLRTKCEKLE